MVSTREKYYLPIEKALQTNGPMGVNELARVLDVPVSSVQNWLQRQNYFEKNSDRKWQLPGEKKTTSNLAGELRAVIDEQVRAIRRLQEMLTTQLENTVDFITDYEIKGPPQGNSEQTDAPVAAFDSRLVQLDSDAKKLQDIFNKRELKANTPEEYRELLNHYDHIGLIIKEGKDFTTKFLEDEIFSLLAGRITTLSEETIGILKENQK